MQRVVDTHPDTAIRQTATDVQVSIATHGRVSLSTCGSTTTDSAQTEPPVKSDINNAAELKPKPLIEIIGSSDDHATELSSSQSALSAFQTAVTETSDVLVPVRGHGLLTLRRLVDSGNPEALNCVDKLLLVCDKTVDDTDSYVYLNAVQLLASLAARLPQQTLPWLADKYLSVSHSPAADVECHQSVSDRRMKLGEVLVKTSSALGNEKLLGFTITMVKTIVFVSIIIIIFLSLQTKSIGQT